MRNRLIQAARDVELSEIPFFSINPYQNHMIQPYNGAGPGPSEVVQAGVGVCEPTGPWPCLDFTRNTELGVENKEAELRKKFAEVELDADGIERLKKAFNEKSLDALYKRYIALTAWSREHLEELSKCLINLGVFNMGRNYAIDKAYAFFYLIVRDGLSPENAAEKIKKIEKENRRYYLGALASGVKEPFLSDQLVPLFNRITFGALSLPVKLHLVNFMFNSNIAHFIENNLKATLSLPRPILKIVCLYLVVEPSNRNVDCCYDFIDQQLRQDLPSLEMIKIKLKDFFDNYADFEAKRAENRDQHSAAAAYLSGMRLPITLFPPPRVDLVLNQNLGNIEIPVEAKQAITSLGTIRHPSIFGRLLQEKFDLSLANGGLGNFQRRFSP